MKNKKHEIEKNAGVGSTGAPTAGPPVAGPLEALPQLTHQDSGGRVRMVDIGNKNATARTALAWGSIFVGADALTAMTDGSLAKGDVWAASRVAGILAAKRTGDFLPLTHPLRLDAVHVHLFPWGDARVGCLAEARATDRTGVEMEAMVAASVALLNVYDMVKALGKGAVMENIRLLRKTGGKSGDWLAPGLSVGRIEKLATSIGKGTPKTPCDQIDMETGHGLHGDAHRGNWHRQVSLLGVESIEKMRVKGLEVDFGSFAENVATSGICLYELSLGTLLLLGDAVLLEVTQIGKECHSRCAVYHQAGDCVMPREGIFGVVVQGGSVQRGDRLLSIPPCLCVPTTTC